MPDSIKSIWIVRKIDSIFQEFNAILMFENNGMIE